MSPQGLIVQENLETDTVVPASVKTPSSVKETKSVTKSPGKNQIQTRISVRSVN